MNNDPNLNESSRDPASAQQNYSVPENTPPEKRCPRCVRTLPANAVFCGECGMNLQNVSQTPYTAPQPTPASQNNAPLKTGEFFLILFLSGVPLIGLILQFVWAFSSAENPNRRNLCRAFLIMRLIGVVLGIVIGIVYASLFGSIVSEIISSGMNY